MVNSCAAAMAEVSDRWPATDRNVRVRITQICDSFRSLSIIPNNPKRLGCLEFLHDSPLPHECLCIYCVYD